MFPYEIVPMEEELNRQLMEDFKGKKCGFVQVGPKKWCLPAIYKEQAEGFYNYPLRSDDIWLVTFPRSGTTLCQEIIWLLNHNLDYVTSSGVAMEKRFPFFEFSLMHSKELHEEVLVMNNSDPVVAEKLENWRRPMYLQEISPPRHFKTHLPLSLLPTGLLQTCKVIYVARNPKDVAVSYYHHNRLFKNYNYKSNFVQYWNYFSQNLVMYAPYWDHVKEAWDRRNDKNMLFLFYEDLVANMEGIIKKIADFLGKTVSEEEMYKLCSHMKIDNFRKVFKMMEIHVKGTMNEGKEGFIRKGKIGENEEFNEELNKSAEEWIRKQLKTTDLRFPVLRESEFKSRNNHYKVS